MMVLVRAVVETYMDYIYAGCLRLFRKKEDMLSLQDLKRIIEIEKKAYTEEFCTYSNCDSLEAFQSECGCFNIAQIYYKLEDDWYFIAVRHYNFVELVDFASVSKKCFKMLQVVSWLFDNFSKSKVRADCRESTSYQLMKVMEKRGKIDIVEDEPHIRNLEIFHRITVVKRKNN